MTLPRPRLALPSPAAARGWRRTLAAIAIALAATAPAAQTPRLEAPAVDPEVLAHAAELAYAKELARGRAAKTLEWQGPLAARARRSIEPLASYAPDVLPAAAEWKWTVTVEKRPDAVALCLPTGRILVSSGLLDRVALTDDEFAAVLAHVIAHALIGHDANEAAAAYARKRGTTAPDPDPNRASVELANFLGKLMVTPHYDAAAEQAADKVGLELLARAGIDPAVAPAAWRKVAAAGGSAPDVAALHPLPPERLAALEKAVPEAVPLYQKALTARPPAALAPPMLRR